MKLTYLIPCRKLTALVASRISVLTEFLVSRKDIDFVIVTGERPECEPSDRRIKIVYDESTRFSFWKKVAAASRYEFEGGFVVLMADDDLNFVLLEDLENWDDNVNCGQSRHVMIIPKALGAYTLFDGWTHFFASVPYECRAKQVSSLIGEGPVSVYSTYRSSYFRSIASLIDRLDGVLSRVRAGESIIEDFINLSNLVSGVQPLRNSTLLRVLNSRPLNERGFRMSRDVFQELEERGMLNEVCSILLDHLMNCVDANELNPYSLESVRHLLKKHVDGYAAANSRKWRGWIDVEFRPFENEGRGLLVTSADRKFNPVYYWGGRHPLGSEVFPVESFLSRTTSRELIRQLPDSYWSDIHLPA